MKIKTLITGLIASIIFISSSVFADVQNIEITSSLSSIPADGQSSVDIVITPKDEMGAPVLGAILSIDIENNSDGTKGAVSPNIMDNSDGTYAANFTSGTSEGDVLIKVYSNKGQPDEKTGEISISTIAIGAEENLGDINLEGSNNEDSLGLELDTKDLQLNDGVDSDLLTTSQIDEDNNSISGIVNPELKKAEIISNTNIKLSFDKDIVIGSKNPLDSFIVSNGGKELKLLNVKIDKENNKEVILSLSGINVNGNYNIKAVKIIDKVFYDAKKALDPSYEVPKNELDIIVNGETVATGMELFVILGLLSLFITYIISRRRFI